MEVFYLEDEEGTQSALYLVGRGGDLLDTLGGAQRLTQLCDEERAARARGQYELAEGEVKLVHLSKSQ